MQQKAALDHRLNDEAGAGGKHGFICNFSQLSQWMMLKIFLTTMFTCQILVNCFLRECHTSRDSHVWCSIPHPLPKSWIHAWYSLTCTYAPLIPCTHAHSHIDSVFGVYIRYKRNINRNNTLFKDSQHSEMHVALHAHTVGKCSLDGVHTTMPSSEICVIHTFSICHVMWPNCTCHSTHRHLVCQAYRKQ